MSDFHQWTNAEPLVSARPGYVGAEDQLRLASYTLYEQMYWSTPQTFRVVQRGSEDDPIYIPSGRQIVETLHRYLANGFSVVNDPSMGSDTEQAESMNLLNALLRRERFNSRFSSNKRYGIIRGDWMFRITANPEREEGSRLSLVAIDPAQYFKVHNPDNVDEIIGADLASIIMEGDDEFVQKTSYRKQTGRGGPSPITIEEAIYETDASGLPGVDQGNPVRVTIPLTVLPPPIDQIPVYHIPHFDEPGALWGSSELRGFERLMTAINQTISDEELALALEGLGLYTCDAGPPVDPTTGATLPWDIGPGRVIELPAGHNFGRVSGIQSIAPNQEHLKYIHEQMDQAVAIPQVAKGRVSVDVAESGIALTLEMGPILAKAGEKELIITDVLINMLFDLRKWFAAYERVNLDNIVWLPAYGDKIPVNRVQKVSELLQLYGTGTLVSGQWVRGELKKLGYEFPEEAEFMQQILTEQQAFLQAQTDVFGARVDQELDAEVEGAGTETE